MTAHHLRRVGLLAAVLVLTVLALARCTDAPDEPEPDDDTTAEAAVDIEPPREAGQSAGVAHGEGPDDDEADDADDPGDIAEPSRVRVPSIDVDDELIPVGLLDDGAMEVPDFGLAGWYDLGPMPGEPGPSVITAHVDSRDGPDVFYRLSELEPGDLVHVDLVDGRTVTFEVEDGEQVDKEELPTDRIWADTDDRMLTLITCGGIFDRSIGHYTDNIIVYTSFVGVDEG